jgi:hypothetical protein
MLPETDQCYRRLLHNSGAPRRFRPSAAWLYSFTELGNQTHALMGLVSGHLGSGLFGLLAEIQRLL